MFFRKCCEGNSCSYFRGNLKFGDKNYMRQQLMLKTVCRTNEKIEELLAHKQ